MGRFRRWRSDAADDAAGIAMSVINNVLKQLDDRPSQFAPIKLSLNEQEHRRSILQPLLWGLLIILLALAFYFAYEEFQQAKLNVPESLPASVQIQAATVVNKPAEQTAPAVAVDKKPVMQPEVEVQAITGLQINESAGSLDLSLQLESGAQSFLRQHAKNRYVFQITNTHKKIIAPDIEGNAWLKNIEIRKNASGTEIQFDTVDKILVETHGQQQGDSYDWLIRLKKAPELKPEIEKKTVAISSLQNVKPKKLHGVIEKAVNREPKKQTATNVRLQIRPVAPLLSDDKKYSKAILALRQGKWSSAQQQLQALVGSRADRKARKSLLGLYERRAATAALRALLQQSLQIYPEDSDFRMMDAGGMFAAGRYTQLVAQYKAESRDKNIINLVAVAQQSLGDHAAAIEAYQRSLQLDKNQPHIQVSLAISLEQQKQFSQALRAYQSAQRSGALNLRLQQFVQQRISQLSKAG
jgi:tetratricopeptide (TPR) repeat protein